MAAKGKIVIRGRQEVCVGALLLLALHTSIAYADDAGVPVIMDPNPAVTGLPSTTMDSFVPETAAAPAPGPIPPEPAAPVEGAAAASAPVETPNPSLPRFPVSEESAALAPAAPTPSAASLETAPVVNAPSLAPADTAAAAPAAAAPVPPTPAAPPAVAAQAPVAETPIAPLAPQAVNISADAATANNAVPPKPIEQKPLAPVTKGAGLPASALPASSASTVESSLDNNAWKDSEFINGLEGGEGFVTLDLQGGSVKPDIADPILLNEAVAFALKNNFESQASSASVKSAHWEKIGAYSMYGPAIDLKVSTGTERSTPAAYNDSTGTRVPFDDHRRRDRVYALRQPIIDLAVISDILSAGSKEDFAGETQRDAREGIAYDTVNVYLKLLQASISVKLADQYKGYLDDLAKRMQARVEGGGATPGDLDRIKGRATIAESARIEAVGEYQADLAEFKRLTHVTPARLVIPDKLSPVVPADADTAVERATVLNPSYMASLLKIDVAKGARNRAFAELAPKVSLEWSDTYEYDAGGAAHGNPVDGIYPNQDDERVLLVAHWAINGGNEISAGMAGIEKIREARYRAQDVRMRIEQGIQSSYNAINAANLRLAVVKKGVEANARVVKDFEYQYENGGRSLFELLDAHEQLYSSRLNLMRLAISRAQASYLIRRQIGDLVPTLIDSEQPAKKE